MLGEATYQPYAINTFSHNGKQFTTLKPAHYVSAHSVKPYYRQDGTFVSGYWRDGDKNKLINTHTKYIRGNPNAAQ